MGRILRTSIMVLLVLFMATDNTIVGTNESATINGSKKMVEAKKLKTALLKMVNEEIVLLYCDDYDGDGVFEAFALVGNKYEDVYDGSVWFVDGNGAKKIKPNNKYWINTDRVLDFGSKKYFVIGKYYTTGDSSYVWGVKNSKAYQPYISGKGQGLTQVKGQRNMTMIDSTYDGTTTGGGHTYKVYYYYWDGDFKEYGGLKITQKQLLKCNGAKKVIDAIKEDGSRILSIYYRANGIININYSNDFSNANATLMLTGESVSLVKLYDESTALNNADYGGIYEKAHLPKIASYPESFPVK